MTAELIPDLPSEDYHADEVSDRPTLSASIAHILVTQSPAHAREAHPQLNPNYERKDDQKFDVGRACHALLLEGCDLAYMVRADSWRTNDAKAAREEARAEGRIPFLPHEYANVMAMLDALTEQIAAHQADPPLFDSGVAEQTLVWEEDGVACRARLDWLRHDLATIDDLKTTARSADPAAYSRALFGVGGDVQAAMYVRGVQKLTERAPEFRWVVCETTPPYALSVISPGPDILALGNAKVDRALATWRECLENDRWPSYPDRVCYAELPGYEESRWLEREAREEMAA